MSEQAIVWDLPLIQKYNYSGPRYTSYPTALEFNQQYDNAAFIQAAARYPERPLSLYLHIPFCHKLCYFCGCNKLVTRRKHKADEYLQWLEREIRGRAKLFSGRKVSQMHWGGGTPTYLNKNQISKLMGLLRHHFDFLPDAEISIEIDPREIELDMIDHLRSEGFNRLSMGVQDFNKEVQHLVNREQDEEFIFALVARARETGFNSTSIDLIYGLPKQTPESFAFTLERVLALSPDRMSVFNYAHLPSLFAAQRKIKEHDLPSAEQKLDILQETIATLTSNGYQFIGMDHFARPDDELAVAQREGKLHRNFQGYTTQEECDLLGLGVSAISMLGDSYSQNQKELKTYYAELEKQEHALWRGLTLSQDDCIRRDVIKALICNFRLNFIDIEQQYELSFTRYFAEDLQLLTPLVDDGLVEVNEKQIWVTPRGRLLIRNICMCFDIYLRQQVRQHQFSRVI
ncbi:oxygen-independent coproporphyrinogen III oxidase [Photorhabdus laumondii subsp. laumondii]|uniref:Coproporphyrinogen-III oxidase n=2 Tax=Photorhabdus laumondii subsp. laumondii TaxID=141679 RepID=Q7N9T3_PHOLL|nr:MULTISPECIES: oxygen-independent coproporphyrinogen III oxidase [Photorhabdus]AWK40222.1 oxygen-independent coproporphyrinogen III oxidase [Photorhabdus laumondii subsp. laumondii]AXG41055.1 oxygen-independent coproporphyrinogen III oxidase [Photorhabdus laumondii subsp. laumondii]AXG45568.1 oxygen-independent coproporphyrinogen III oxidase [Photorhabdus laumondii subsp. laumondii]MCC8382242.1 oxygen-independent coproporphyrinogen III oxidase [Photorhabdus laumondii]MCC8386906.1 oxygen-inde